MASPTTTTIDSPDVFALYIDYSRDAPEASRVFRAMAELIDTIDRLDADLARTVAREVDVSSSLTEIEASSLRAIVHKVLQYHDGYTQADPIAEAIVSFITQAREQVLRLVGAKQTVGHIEELSNVTQAIDQIAEDTGVAKLLTYSPPQPKNLLEAMSDLGKAAGILSDGDRLKYESSRSIVTLESRFALEPGRIDELLTDRVVPAITTAQLVVKKPDYLGNSMWQFKHDARTLEAKILDEQWLNKFQSRGIPLRPGDAIVAHLRAELRLDKEGNVVSERYMVTKVFGVLPGNDLSQRSLPFEDVA